MTTRILPCGDRALTVELSSTVDAAVNSRIIALAKTLEERPVAGIDEVVPTYRSIMVLYDPAIIRGTALAALLHERLAEAGSTGQAGRVFEVPVVYGGAVGQDLEELARMKDMTPEAVIALHAAAEYRVYMIGFAPGFAYLGGVPEALHTPRLAVPRQRVEAGAIGIGGQQGSINSVAGPSGWRYLGQTPVRTFDPARSNAFLLKAGDRVRFRPVDVAEAAEITARIAAGETGMREIAA